MTRRLCFVSLALLFAVPVVQAAPGAPACQFEPAASGPRKIGRWIDYTNWLAPENQRLTLPAANTFMPSLRMLPQGSSEPLNQRPERIDLENPTLVDPLDGTERTLAFLLDSRLGADGVLVMQNGNILAERYRNGLRAENPRLLMQATRPLLNLLGAISIAQSKLSADKAVSRYLPTLGKQAGLRKISVRRLLENEENHTWNDADLNAWRMSGGWTGEPTVGGVRTWLAQPGRWEKPLTEQNGPASAATPDDDLLAWLLAESNGKTVSRLFCEHLQSRQVPEHPVFWLTDSKGIELADGLALSLRDFGRLGNVLLDARASRNSTRIPGWFIETLGAPSGFRTPEIKGLTKGSEARYGFIHLGGEANRVALIGAHGTSLYIDFDRRLVIALYASYPAPMSPALLASLETFWKSVSQATQRKR